MKFLPPLAAAGLLAATAFTPALAQTVSNTGYEAGDIMAHVSALGVIPMNYSSGTTLPGFKVHASPSFSPEIDGAYFFSPSISLELIAATTRHNVWVTKGAAKVKAGSIWVLPPTLTVQYHLPQLGPVRPYAGIGLTVAFFYGGSRAADVTKQGGYSTAVGPTVDAGFDVPVTGNWSANVDVKQMFLVTGTHVDNGAVGAHTDLDPLAVGVGVGYLF